jgi:hypothetical protein
MSCPHCPHCAPKPTPEPTAAEQLAWQRQVDAILNTRKETKCER